MTTRLLPDHVPALLGWEVRCDPDHLYRRFEFLDFSQAFAFMTQVAALADAADHHPDWRNVYRTVEIHLSTHEVGGLTERDISLARAINGLIDASR